MIQNQTPKNTKTTQPRKKHPKPFENFKLRYYPSQNRHKHPKSHNSPQRKREKKTGQKPLNESDIVKIKRTKISQKLQIKKAKKVEILKNSKYIIRTTLLNLRILTEGRMNRMKKKSLLTITFILLLTLSMLGVILTGNTQLTLPLNSSQNHLNPTAKSYTGSGDQLNALLYITNNTNTTPNATSTSDNIYIPCPNGWKILWTNITISNINAPNVTVEPNASSPDSELSLVDAYAMSFQLTNGAYLDNISVMLSVDASGTANFWVYNATDNGSGVPRPQSSIKKISDVSITSSGWQNVDFGHVFLNTSSTYDKTFFIVIQRSDLVLDARWRAIRDDPAPGAGYVYKFDSGSWLARDYDCKLRVNVSASQLAPAESAWPSDINLTINGSQVSDVSKGNGEWINDTVSPVSTGYILFDVNSTWMTDVSFSYVWNVTYGKDASANTNFVVSYDSASFWNVTVDASDAFPLTDNGVNHINITGIPQDWGDSSSMAYNQTGDSWVELLSHPPDTISFLASNGTWIVNCTAPNYVSGISFGVDGEPVENATLYDLLDINVLFNTSLRSNVTGTVNLKIYDPGQILNYTDEKTVDQAISTSFSWDVGSTASSTGTYNLTVSFHDGFVVGYNESQLSVVSLVGTQLAVTWSPQHYEYPGPVPVLLHYNRTDSGQGIAGAKISAYFENNTPIAIPSPTDHGNGSYGVELNFGTAFDVHRVYFNTSKRLFEPSVSSQIQINYTKVLVNIILNTPQSVFLNTPLVAAATLRYATNNSAFAGQTVYFNFSLKFTNGTSTVIQRNSLTNYEGRAEVSIVVPLDTVELNVKAFYSGTSTVFGVVSSTNSVTLTSEMVSPLFMGLFSYMFLTVARQSQNLTLYILVGALLTSVVAAGVVASRVRRRRLVPLRALASLENIIVDHIATGVTLWSFDFLKMEQDVALVSGFMSAVKSFMGEMQKGGLRKLETELGTFIREDGDFLTATCITCGNTPQEEEWIRRKLRSFLAEAESQHLDLLQSWRGDVQTFRESLPLILASVIDLDKAESLVRERISKLQRSKEKLQIELNRLGSQLEDLTQQLESGKISESKFEAARAKIEPKYDEVQKEYIHTSLCLSRVPPRLEAGKPTPEVTREVEKIQDRFLKIRMEIEELRRKELDGTITSQDIKRRDKLYKELMKLIEKLDKLQK